MNDEPLIHWGVPGMKWGVRKARAKTWLKEAGKVTKNSLLHPNITNKANADSIRATKSKKELLRRTLAYQSTKDLKDVNRRVDAYLKKQKNKKLKDIKVRQEKMKAAKKWMSEAGKLTLNSILHPIVSDKANRESIASSKTISEKLRRSMLYQNTSDIKDVNRRIEQALTNR